MNKAVIFVVMAAVAGSGHYGYQRYQNDHLFRRDVDQKWEEFQEWYEGVFFEDKSLSEDMSDASSTKSWNQQQRDFHEGRTDGSEMLKKSPEERASDRKYRPKRGSTNRSTGEESVYSE